MPGLYLCKSKHPSEKAEVDAGHTSHPAVEPALLHFAGGLTPGKFNCPHFPGRYRKPLPPLGNALPHLFIVTAHIDKNPHRAIH